MDKEIEQRLEDIEAKLAIMDRLFFKNMAFQMVFVSYLTASDNPVARDDVVKQINAVYRQTLASNEQIRDEVVIILAMLYRD